MLHISIWLILLAIVAWLGGWFRYAKWYGHGITRGTNRRFNTYHREHALIQAFRYMFWMVAVWYFLWWFIPFVCNNVTI